MTIRFEAALFFFLGLVAFTIGLSSQEIIGFETRFYLFVVEMWRHGLTWFPTTYGELYPDYPVTGMAAIYALSKWTGYLNKLTLVLPSAIAAATTLTFTYLIGALHSKKWGMTAVFCLLFTVTFVAEARTISLDQFTTAITTICFYLVYSSRLLAQSTRRWIWIFPLFILGFAMRGPLGLIIPTGVVVTFFLLEKEIKFALIIGLCGSVLLGICTALLLLIAYHAGGSEFFSAVLKMEVWSRMIESATPPFYFYFVEAFGAYAVIYPLAILVAGGIYFLPRSAEKKLLLQLIAWALIIFIGLSVPADKKVRYILPAAPALALLSGYLFTIDSQQKYLHTIQRIFNYFCKVFPLLCLIGMVYVHWVRTDLVFWYKTIILFLIAAQVMQFFWWRKNLISFAIAVVTFLLLNFFFVEPMTIHLNRNHDFVMQMEMVRQQHSAKLVFFEEGKDGLAIKYVAHMPREDFPIFVEKEPDLMRNHFPMMIIATAEHFAEIKNKNKFSIVARGKLGHESVIVFSKG